MKINLGVCKVFVIKRYQNVIIIAIFVVRKIENRYRLFTGVKKIVEYEHVL